MNTATVALAVTPAVFSTFVSHFLDHKPLKGHPTGHLSYHEGLRLVRKFLTFASQHTVEDLQAFTSQWVPTPQWIKVEVVAIPDDRILQAAELLKEQLGPEGIKLVGGKSWWQWRRPDVPLEAAWIEMRSDYNQRKKTGDPGKRIMLYVHGGAFFFGSVDEHRYQMQRHARKLKARVLGIKYRLAPQFPFPCGLQDCLAAYLYLLTIHDPTQLILAGDSAGGGMVVSMLVCLRDRGIPLPSGAVLISPWVDLTHSFPSVSAGSPYDYIPECGFHQKPSKAWPPMTLEEHSQLVQEVAKEAISGRTESARTSAEQALEYHTGGAAGNNDHDVRSEAAHTYISVDVDGKIIQLKEQIQMYTTNSLLGHPLVSPVMQPTLGGLPPLLIMVGGGEVLRDEQIYLAHKCADPEQYTPRDSLMDDAAREQLKRFKPTDVQLQVWEDLCHVAPTLSFTSPAKYMYRAIAQFAAWALARAQEIAVEVQNDDNISVISTSSNDDLRQPSQSRSEPEAAGSQVIGRAGDKVPPFKDHMIRQSVSHYGVIRALAPPSDLASCQMDRNAIGVVNAGPVRKWLVKKAQMDMKFSATRAKVQKQRFADMAAGLEVIEGEIPPPSALAGRRKKGGKLSARKKRRRSKALSLWSMWGSKHDEMTLNRERSADHDALVKVATSQEGEGARPAQDIRKQTEHVAKEESALGRTLSRATQPDQQQRTLSEGTTEESTPLSDLMAKRVEKHDGKAAQSAPGSGQLLASNPPHLTTGVTGKRPIVDGIAVPFTLNKEADTASMVTLTSHVDTNLSPVPCPTQSNGTPAGGIGPKHPHEPASAVAAYDLARPASPPVANIDDVADEEPVTAGTPRKAGSPTFPATALADRANGVVTVPSIVRGPDGTLSKKEGISSGPQLDTFYTV